MNVFENSHGFIWISNVIGTKESENIAVVAAEIMDSLGNKLKELDLEFSWPASRSLIC